ncbi:MAG: diadenylate cyclase CdaA [Alistipes sp.]|nr:diadenylate cyclase CdaA [Alistipes sp.]MDO5496850.1 diadenylate cyclase CdaA [Alistipes sp.]
MDFIPFTFIDFVDITLVALLMFGLYRMTRGTNTPYIFTGLIIIYIVWIAVQALNMTLLQTILGQIVSVGVLAVIIIFQPELRSFLQMLGMRQKGFNFVNRIFAIEKHREINIEPIVRACSEMSLSKTGALIVISQKSDLADIIENGITINADLSVSLLENIFFKNAPLHDGAVVVQNNRVVAAKCILPVTQSNVPKSYGTRHRAAIGITETSDAIAITVSEETGGISVAFAGKIERNIAPKNLVNIISSHIVKAEPSSRRREKKSDEK